ncbi:MAG: RNA polymerase sigma factor [Fluviicola sp.]|jgi:RNA polymerase sigma-70 factor (ECF subfamily)|nr:RNA polymerase sigma factor [Fluviicola sp.]
MLFFKPSYKKSSDEELMLSISKGEKKAFDELYARYADALLRYFTRLLWKDREKAEDFVHDLFAKIIQKPELFDASRTFKTWVYSVANNMCKNEYKKQEVRKNTTNGIDHVNVIAQHDVLKETHESIFQNTYNESIQQLDSKHREVFSLRHEDGLSIKEIAEILDLNEGTVKSRLFYATKQLADLLKEFNPMMNR